MNRKPTHSTGKKTSPNRDPGALPKELGTPRRPLHLKDTRKPSDRYPAGGGYRILRRPFPSDNE